MRICSWFWGAIDSFLREIYCRQANNRETCARREKGHLFVGPLKSQKGLLFIGTSKSLFSSLLSELGLARLLQGAWAVWLHDLGLQIGTGSQVARSQVDATSAGWFLHCLSLGLGNLLLGGIVALQSHHFLSLAHLQHLVLWRSHLFKRFDLAHY